MDHAAMETAMTGAAAKLRIAGNHDVLNDRA